MEMPTIALQKRGGHEAFQALQQAGITLYMFDPAGFQGQVRDHVSFADSTGGRSFASNTAWEDVPQVFREIGTYYILGFRADSFRADDRFRFVDVTVNRPGLEVRTQRPFQVPHAEPQRALTQRRGGRGGRGEERSRVSEGACRTSLR